MDITYLWKKVLEKYQPRPISSMMKYPIIQRLQDKDVWTLSDINKVPIDANYFLDTNIVKPARILDEPYPLTTLRELNTRSELDMVNRTYYLNAAADNMFMIDVEPVADPQLKWNILNFPANYTELSTNGGVHLFIEIPQDLITPENQYLLDLPAVKAETDKDEEAPFEFLFARHFVTFTKRMVLDKLPTDFNQDFEAKAKLKNLLDYIVAIDKPRKERRERMQEARKEFKNRRHNTDGAVINELLTQHAVLNHIQQMREKSIEDYNNDGSRYEFSIAFSCGLKLLKVIRQLQNNPVNQGTYDNIKEQDIILTIADMLEDAVPYRDKHDEFRDELPWLVYTAQNAYLAVISKIESED